MDINPDYRWNKTLARVRKGRIIVSKRTMAKGCWGVLPLHIHRGKINTYLFFLWPALSITAKAFRVCLAVEGICRRISRTSGLHTVLRIHIFFDANIHKIFLNRWV